MAKEVAAPGVKNVRADRDFDVGHTQPHGGFFGVTARHHKVLSSISRGAKIGKPIGLRSGSSRVMKLDPRRSMLFEN